MNDVVMLLIYCIVERSLFQTTCAGAVLDIAAIFHKQLECQGGIQVNRVTGVSSVEC